MLKLEIFAMAGAHTQLFLNLWPTEHFSCYCGPQVELETPVLGHGNLHVQ
jgi:hypothetical protein